MLMTARPECRETVMWILTAYTFLLRQGSCSPCAVCAKLIVASPFARVPSECLPLVVRGEGADSPPVQQSEVWCSDHELVLRLKRRKNRELGSRLVSVWLEG